MDEELANEDYPFSEIREGLFQNEKGYQYYQPSDEQEDILTNPRNFLSPELPEPADDILWSKWPYIPAPDPPIVTGKHSWQRNHWIPSLKTYIEPTFDYDGSSIIALPFDDGSGTDVVIGYVAKSKSIRFKSGSGRIRQISLWDFINSLNIREEDAKAAYVHLRDYDEKQERLESITQQIKFPFKGDYGSYEPIHAGDID